MKIGLIDTKLANSSFLSMPWHYFAISILISSTSTTHWIFWSRLCVPVICVSVVSRDSMTRLSVAARVADV
ncbi:hypothetical protein HH308_17835 [Gordonia sp. TBRC 11910]|uniref:Uncharacterized protein n=1 Tax=Gordonia asplenii TaxID=2725283 RepID=A0A848L637_9ACTN|nr:hypothetical protein [Gordonia asplenii]